MSTFIYIFYVTYIVVALFYVICGVILMLYPHRLKQRISSLFPVLATFRYTELTQSLNLIFVGLGLIIVSKLIIEGNILGFYYALILSALEVFLGYRFYYKEASDIPQTVIHIGLHGILCVILLWGMTTFFSPQITHKTTWLASTITSMMR